MTWQIAREASHWRKQLIPYIYDTVFNNLEMHMKGNLNDLYICRFGKVLIIYFVYSFLKLWSIDWFMFTSFSLSWSYICCLLWSFIFSMYWISLHREQALLTARREPILSRERVYEHIRYPNVYDSYAEATKMPAFVGGARVRR